MEDWWQYICSHCFYVAPEFAEDVYASAQFRPPVFCCQTGGYQEKTISFISLAGADWERKPL